MSIMVRILGTQGGNHHIRWVLQFSILGGLIGAAWLGPLTIGKRGPWNVFIDSLLGALVGGVPYAMVTGVLYRVMATRFDAGRIGSVRWWVACLFSGSWPILVYLAATIIKYGNAANIYDVVLLKLWSFLWVCSLMTSSILYWMHTNEIRKATLATAPLLVWISFHLANYYIYVRP